MFSPGFKSVPPCYEADRRTSHSLTHSSISYLTQGGTERLQSLCARINLRKIWATDLLQHVSSSQWKSVSRDYWEQQLLPTCLHQWNAGTSFKFYCTYDTKVGHFTILFFFFFYRFQNDQPPWHAFSPSSRLQNAKHMSRHAFFFFPTPPIMHRSNICAGRVITQHLRTEPTAACRPLYVCFSTPRTVLTWLEFGSWPPCRGGTPPGGTWSRPPSARLSEGSRPAGTGLSDRSL